MSTATLELNHLINGKWVTGGGDTASSVNPADPSEVVGTYATATTAELDAALTAAGDAGAAWDRLGVLARGKILRTAAGLLEDRTEDIAVLMSREEGKIVADARAEIGGTVETLYYHAGAARRPTGVTYP
ncbi:MAG: aldehyde dehydrogenase family protein, partial [Humibacillus sp.]|nr:aldehyde dehydrogenase family protein [Humibacillus sp.]